MRREENSLPATGAELKRKSPSPAAHSEAEKSAVELDETLSRCPGGCSSAFLAGTERVKELHLDKQGSLKLKLPRSLSESRAREVSNVNKCHH